MNTTLLTYDDCCLLSNICLNSKRISYILECRFKSNSIRTGFDFKTFLPAQPTNNTKISRSLLKYSPIKQNLINNSDDNLSSESSDDEIEILSPKILTNSTDDDYLDSLAEWEPNKCEEIIESNEEEEEEIKNDTQQITNDNTHFIPMNLSTETSTTEVEDLLITFIHRPIKTEPIIDEISLSQLDGQTDFLFNNTFKQQKRKNKNKINTKIKSDKTISTDEKQNCILSQDQTIHKNNHHQYIHNQRHSSSLSQTYILNYMILPEEKLKSDNSYTNFIQQDTSKDSKSIDLLIETNIKKNKGLNNKLNHQLQIKKRSPTQNKKILPMKQSNKTIPDYFKFINNPTKNENIQYFAIDKQKTKLINKKTEKRSANYFDECIVIDDDDDDDNIKSDNEDNIEDYDDDNGNIKSDNEDYDLKEIERQGYSISNTIYAREKLLAPVIHYSSMCIKWLCNLELLLLEHISICHKKNIQPLNKFYLNSIIKSEYNDNILSYDINSSLILIIIENFIKIFIIRNSNYIEEEFSFYQFSLTSYIRYLFIELPTYNHKKFSNDNYCYECYQYNLIQNNLFDLLFDLIEYDICEIYNKEKYHSTFIEDEYFNQLKPMKKNFFYRIKFIIYFIELIEIHKNKCQNKKEKFFFNNENKIFQLIEDSIQYIIYNINNLNNQRISICLNIMELCLLFSNEKENRIKKIASFLAKLCEGNSAYLYLFLFDENLLCDIRLLLINEIISKKFNMKFISINHIHEFFHLIEIALKPPNLMDDIILILIRSLFNTYADLMINIKHSMSIYTPIFEQITSMLHTYLESIYLTLMNLSHDPNYFQQIKRTLILLRLLKCKWHKL